MTADDNLLAELDLPRQRPLSEGHLDVRPRRMAAWVADLPLANVGETARRIYTALGELNTLSFDPEDRFKDLELLAAPVQTLETSLEKHFIEQRFPLPDRQRAAAELAQTLPARMATGYKLVLAGLAERGVRPSQRVAITALQRAVRYLTEALVRAYQAYAPEPQGLWRQLHLLYQYAEAHAVHETVVKDALHGTARSVAECYKHALLLALAGPYRLLQGEVAAVHRELAGWAARTQLVAPGKTGPDGFPIDLAEDAPPRAGGTRIDPASRVRVITTDRLVHALREQLEAPATGGLEPDLLRRLARAWGAADRRRFARAAQQAPVEAIIGLTAVHQFLEARGAGNAFPAQRDTASGRPRLGYRSQFVSVPTDSDYGRVPDVWDLHYHGPDRTAPSPGMLLNPHSSREAPAHTPDALELVDTGPGGQRLRWADPARGRARIGELICMPEPEGASPVQPGVGVIRWMCSVDGDRLDLGIQMLAPTADPVAVRRYEEDAAQPGPYGAALLLPEIRPLGQPATLLLAAVGFRERDLVALHAGGTERVYRLTRQLERNGAFAQFEFALSDSVTTVMEGDTGERASAPFEGLWSRL
ncbi:MAG: hypothetical protein GWO02_12615 [Gammaproteobacteria bacterium]|nr:hypothetical protein [Gammaproteobacteria bacterium]